MNLPAGYLENQETRARKYHKMKAFCKMKNRCDARKWLKKIKYQAFALFVQNLQMKRKKCSHFGFMFYDENFSPDQTKN